MKRVLLALMLGTSVLGFAQDKKNIVKTEIVDKIKNYKPTDLVPYSKDGDKWALMDVKSRKVLTDFVLNEARTFIPKFYVYIDINGLQEEMEISSDYTISPIIEPPPYTKGMELLMKTNELGFKVDQNGKIISHHSSYYDISEPILYKGVYYVITSFSKRKGRMLINEKGEEQKGFYFKEISNIGYKDEKTNEAVFYVEDFDGKKGFVTISGKKKLYGELMNEPKFYVIGEGYHSAFGYSLQKDNDDIKKIKKSGIVDLTTQEWLIKPQERYKIYGIRYASSERIMEDNDENRHKATVYFLATDQSGQHFVLDIKGNPILPKK